MGEVTKILERMEAGDPAAADQLFAQVYNELRRMAAKNMAQEKPGQTLEPTALVHEAYIRLVDTDKARHWDSRGHFFTAAAEAMRRILINRARDHQRLKRGGGRKRLDLDSLQVADPEQPENVLLVHEALDSLAVEDSVCADLVKLRFFAGMTLSEAATALNLPRRTADRYWAYARAWLYERLARENSDAG
jgi:RNA polymerase sigma factor (TIGR02999 family)